MPYHYSSSSAPKLSLDYVKSAHLESYYPETVAILKDQSDENTAYLLSHHSKMSSQTFACFVDIWSRVGKPILDVTVTPNYGYKKIQRNILKVYPKSRGELFLYDSKISNSLLEKIAEYFGMSSYGFVCLAYILRNVYGEKCLEEVLDRIAAEKMIFTPVEIMKLFESWGEIGDYPLKWGIEMLSELK